MRPTRPMRRAASLVVALVALAACGKGEQGTPDSAAIAAALPKPYVSDSGAAAPQGEGDKAFLEQMSDHHAGLVQMAYVTRGKVSEPETRKDADMLHEKQQVEQDSMVAILKRDFNETYAPKVLAQHQVLVDSLGKLRGRALAKGFYDMTVQHHQEGVAMIDRFLPSLENVKVKAMAERMKADQQKEIADFQAKAPKKEAIDPRKDGGMPEE